MEIIDKDRYFNTINSFNIVPFTQTDGMYFMHSLTRKKNIHFFINDSINPTLACFGHEKKILSIKMLLIEGESFKSQNDINVKNIHLFYKDISLIGYDIIEICSNNPYNFDYEIAMRQAGYLRPVGQFSMPITKIIDLTTEVKYNKNWNRYIKKSAANNLVFEEIIKPSKKDFCDFEKLYREMIDRKSMSHKLSSEQIEALCKSSNFLLFFVSKNNIRIAGIIIYNINNKAGGAFAATSQNALKLSASFYMYNSLFKHLKHMGVLSFDMEKLEPSTKSINSVFYFKNGIDGKKISLNGEWSIYKNKYFRPLMYFVKKYLMKKREL